MTENDIQSAAQDLHEAFVHRRTVAPLSDRYPGITLAEAYSIQQGLIERRCRQGARVVGRKIGVTSQAVMSMLKVDQPDFGALFDDMAFARGSAIPMANLIQPKAEGEIAFVLKRSLRGPGVTAADVLAATEGVMACFEIVDSRIRDWNIRIQDTVADNASCGVFVLGDRMVRPADVDLYSCGMVLEKNGCVVGVGAGAASMGSPVNAVAWLANTLGRLGIALEAGEIILSGALSGMVPVAQGDSLNLEISGIGNCSVRFA